MASPAYKAKIKYLSFENRILTEESKLQYSPVNVYSLNSSRISETMSCCEYLRRLLCCDTSNQIQSCADHSTSALVGPVGKSYTVNGEPARLPIVQPERRLPILTVTRHNDEELPSLIPEPPPKAPISQKIQNELYKSTSQLLLATEIRASSISGSRYPTKKQASIQFDSIDDVDSRGSTLRYGEKNSFIREVLSCRDSFLKSIEWCDNSLTRGKRYRNIKKDDWIELKGDVSVHDFDAPFFPIRTDIYASSRSNISKFY